MEEADRMIKDLTRPEQETPYDAELADARHMKENIVLLLGHIRDLVSVQHNKYGCPAGLAEALESAEEEFTEALGDYIGKLEGLVEDYEPSVD